MMTNIVRICVAGLVISYIPGLVFSPVSLTNIGFFKGTVNVAIPLKELQAWFTPVPFKPELIAVLFWFEYRLSLTISSIVTKVMLWIALVT